MDFSFSNIKKDVYIDGHEREDVVKYRNEVFFEKWREISRRFIIFAKDGSRKEPFNLRPNKKPLVFVTHDESIFNANDGKRRIWINGDHQPLRPKGKGKGIIASNFLTPGGSLKFPDNVSDEELLRDIMFPKNENGKPVREASLLLEYSKDNYWTGKRLVEQTTKVAIPTLRYTFSDCQAVFAFDNAANHCAFASDALLVSKMNLSFSGKQPRLRDGRNFSENVSQKINFDEYHPDIKLHGQPKGVRQVLIERNLWHDHWVDVSRFLLLFPKEEGCDPGMNSACCATALLQSQRDFKDQKSWLQENVENAGHQITPYPKLHCAMNFIERFWCSAKYYTRNHYNYSFDGLRKTVPAALKSVPTATIIKYYSHCCRFIETYEKRFNYGSKEFHNYLYRSRRRVEDNSKW